MQLVCAQWMVAMDNQTNKQTKKYNNIYNLEWTETNQPTNLNQPTNKWTKEQMNEQGKEGVGF